jgi:hypothetical protein
MGALGSSLVLRRRSAGNGEGDVRNLREMTQQCLLQVTEISRKPLPSRNVMEPNFKTLSRARRPTRRFAFALPTHSDEHRKQKNKILDSTSAPSGIGSTASTRVCA